jgi:hypothetical protein
MTDDINYDNNNEYYDFRVLYAVSVLGSRQEYCQRLIPDNFDIRNPAFAISDLSNLALFL